MYQIVLGDGTSWSINVSDDFIFSWINEMAQLLNMSHEAQKEGAKLHFFNYNPKNHSFQSEIKYNAWIRNEHETIIVWQSTTSDDVLCEVKPNNSDPKSKYIFMSTALQPIYDRSVKIGGLPFHAGLAELEGKGVLISGPGGSGKSTCCRRLPRYWTPLCDDETLVVLNGNNHYRAHPFPTWSEYLWGESNKTWNVQYSVPVSAIFFIEQFHMDEIVPIGAGEAAALITEGAIQTYRTFWQRASLISKSKTRKDLFSNACKIAKRIPCYKLKVSLTGKFWEKIEQVIQ